MVGYSGVVGLSSGLCLLAACVHNAEGMMLGATMAPPQWHHHHGTTMTSV